MREKNAVGVQRPPARWQRMMGEAIEGSRYIILIAVVALLIVAAALFAISVGLAGQKTWEAVDSLLQGDLSTTEVKIAFLGVVTLVLKAVVFYVMATGLYNLFVAPAAVPPVGGVASLADLEIKIAALIILILGATFLERYTSSTDGEDTLLMAAAMGIAVAALVGFQIAIRLDERKSHPPGE